MWFSYLSESDLEANISASLSSQTLMLLTQISGDFILLCMPETGPRSHYGETNEVPETRKGKESEDVKMGDGERNEGWGLSDK